MAKRKISECINVRINVGNYQHIELTKYAEEEIEFDSTKERVEKEDILRDDLIASLVRSMKTIPEKLGKGVANVVEVEEAIKKAIPEWLAKDPIPNIANGALKQNNRTASEQLANKENLLKEEINKIKAIEVREKIEPKTEVKAEVAREEKTEINDPLSNSELFEEDKPKVEEKKEKTSKVEKVAKTDDIFDDDDIFGENSK
jgi:hypothetical protein